MSGDKDGLLYWPKFFLDHSNTSFASWLRLLKGESQRAQSPLSGAGSHFSITVSSWLELPRRLVILFSNVHLLLLFFCLFTQVHLLIDSLVRGQYIAYTHTHTHTHIYIFNNTSALVGWNTMSLFKQSLTGLNSVFSFS